jgi:undecaprenyl-diphosphatase
VFVLKSIILGIVQGITEFIPVSSSGHLVLANHFLNFELQDITFEIMLHVGTLFSVIIYFREDIKKLLLSAVHYQDKSEEYVNYRKVLFFLAIATVATGIVGLLLKELILSIFYNPLFTACMLMITGTIVFISDTVKGNELTQEKTGVVRSIIIGISQAIAIFPGISRSGTTITTSMLTGLKRMEAARFSFLLSIPAIIGVTIMEIRDISSIDSILMPGFFFGTLAAFISGYLVIALLLNMIKKRNLKIFSFYTWTLGIVTILSIVL